MTPILRLFALPLIVAAFCLPCLGFAQSGMPRIERIQGATQVKVVSGDDSEKNAVGGDVLATGDRIETSEGVSVRLIYPDQTKMVIGPGSQVEIQSAPQGDSGSWSRISRGKIRARVPKFPAAKGEPKSRKFRFGTRTPAVIMGVRGTDYQVEVEGEKTAVTLFSGELEVARTEEKLHRPTGAGDTVLLRPGQRMETVPTEEIIQRKPLETSEIKKIDSEMKLLLIAPKAGVGAGDSESNQPESRRGNPGVAPAKSRARFPNPQHTPDVHKSTK